VLTLQVASEDQLLPLGAMRCLPTISLLLMLDILGDAFGLTSHIGKAFHSMNIYAQKHPSTSSGLFQWLNIKQQ
jgi:hypothetical protein